MRRLKKLTAVKGTVPYISRKPLEEAKEKSAWIAEIEHDSALNFDPNTHQPSFECFRMEDILVPRATRLFLNYVPPLTK